MAETHSGGCQCGAVRYRFNEPPRAPMICHCRMCQKAFGSPFAAFVGGPRETFALTRGTLAIFASSDGVERGFCRDCGTPLSYAHTNGNWLCVALASLDHPERFTPEKQFGVEARLGWVQHIEAVPDQPPTHERISGTAIHDSNHQHPDHDTTDWPQHGKQP